jgi:rubredoxin
MENYICTNCGYIYDPETGDEEHGIQAGIPFEELPDDWRCPICYVGKEMFDPL